MSAEPARGPQHGPQHEPQHGPQRPPVPERVRMPLLQLITQQSLDEDYEHVAARRRRSEDPAGPSRSAPARSRVTVTTVVVGIFGVLVAIAAVQTSRSAPAVQASREDLIARVGESRQSVAALQQRIQDLKQEITSGDQRYANLGDTLGRAQAQLAGLQTATGFGPVNGGGVVVTVTDNPNGVPDDEVQDRDLSNLANGLWQAGATAIAVNGHRLTAVSALRNSGTVIRVNGASLSPPYEVTAIGDPRTLAARFAQTSSGARFYDVTHALGMPTTMENGTDLTVPAAPTSMLHLRYAKRPDDTSAKNGHQEGK